MKRLMRNPAYREVPPEWVWQDATRYFAHCGPPLRQIKVRDPRKSAGPRNWGIEISEPVGKERRARLQRHCGTS